MNNRSQFVGERLDLLPQQVSGHERLIRAISRSAGYGLLVVLLVGGVYLVA